MNTPSHTRFKSRRWPIWLAFCGAVVLAVAVLFSSINHGTHPVPVYPAEALPSSMTTSVSSQSSAIPAQYFVKPSAVTQLYVPSVNERLVINNQVLPMPSSCKTVIQPPLSGSHVGSVFQCVDYAMPGSPATGTTVLAGHSSLRIATVFNKLYLQGKSLVGRQVLLKTKTSGRLWLDYTISAVYMPLKTDLPYMGEIWGDGSASSRGRLVLVTCFQDASTGDSNKNFIVVASFAGVK